MAAGRLLVKSSTSLAAARRSLARERLAAARLVLDFTKSRPAATQEVTIGKAEEFLSSLLVDDGQETTESP